MQNFSKLWRCLKDPLWFQLPYKEFLLLSHLLNLLPTFASSYELPNSSSVMLPHSQPSSKYEFPFFSLYVVSRVYEETLEIGLRLSVGS